MISNASLPDDRSADSGAAGLALADAGFIECDLVEKSAVCHGLRGDLARVSETSRVWRRAIGRASRRGAAEPGPDFVAWPIKGNRPKIVQSPEKGHSSRGWPLAMVIC